MTDKAKDYRRKLADEFLHVLEERPLEWKKSWMGGGFLPSNARTGKRYRGINRFRLALVADARGYDDPRWATFNQIKERGWKLHDAKGQGVGVEYWLPYDKEEKRTISWDEFRMAGEPFGNRYVLRVRYSTVFNAKLIDGIPKLPEPEVHDVEPDELVDRLSENMGVEIENDGGDRAFYRLSEDKIHLPLPETFLSDYAYASTALHELAHSTGAPHRLNRDMGGTFGTPEYAYEELVAEISSCFMSVNLNAEQDERHVENHKAYVQSWIQVIRDDPEALARAIRQAEQTASYMEYKAELIPKEEYEKVCRSTTEVATSAVEEARQKEDAVAAVDEAATAIPDGGVSAREAEAGNPEKTREAIREIRKEVEGIRNDTRYLNTFMDGHGIPHDVPEGKEAWNVALKWNAVHDMDDDDGHPTEWAAKLPDGGFLWIDKEGDTRYALYDVPNGDVEPVSIAVTLDEAQENGEEYAERMLELEREGHDKEVGTRENEATADEHGNDPFHAMEDAFGSDGTRQELVKESSARNDKANKETNWTPRR